MSNPIAETRKARNGWLEECTTWPKHKSGAHHAICHGWPLSQRSWEKQKRAALLAGFRIISYDRRGFGQSSQPAVGYDYDTFAEDLNQLMKKLDLREATLVGFSMGTGEVARYLGKYGSERVEKAVFISSIPPFLLKTSDHPNGVDQKVFDGIKELFAADRLAAITKFLSDFYNYDVTKGKLVSEEVFHDSWNVASGASPKGTVDCISTWTTDFRKDLPKIDVPSLVIHGNADRILPYPITGPRLHEALKGSRFVTIEGGPHGIIWTHAERVNQELFEFLKLKTGKRAA